LKKYLPALVAGFGAGVLNVVPLAKSIGCCIIIPVAAYVALLLDRRANPSDELIPTGKAISMGIMTGLFAALFGTFFDVLITLITKSNDLVASFPEMQKMIVDMPLSQQLKDQVIEMLGFVVEQIRETGFSLLYTFSILVNNLIVDIIFGLIGGLIGGKIINSRLQKS
jgi:hypothetical protein